MRRDGELAISCDDLATSFLFQHNDPGDTSEPAYLPFYPDRFEYSLNSVRLRNWEGSKGQHCGNLIMQELQQVVQTRAEIDLRPVRHTVSIVVPAFNEAATVLQCLSGLSALDFGRFELAKEIVFVDGGSTDGTYELASAVPDIRLLRTDAGAGRGAAIRKGIDQARGDVIVLFAADLEYDPKDILRLVFGVARGEYRAVFGTRNVKCNNLSARLATIYGDARFLYLLSKYGGMLLSMSTLMIYNRYISDPLTSLMAFDAAMLKSLGLRANGLDILTEIIAQLCKRGEYILEVPVDFMPRTRAQGKKTTPLDGIRAVLPLIRGKCQTAR